MKQDLKYIALLVACAAVFVIVELLTPKPIDWTITYSKHDKNPYGSYLIDQLLPDLFDEVNNNNLTVYEMEDSTIHNLMIVAAAFGPDEEDTHILLDKVASGSHAFIAANTFHGHFADTLNLETGDAFFQRKILDNWEEPDSVVFNFIHPPLDTTALFPYERQHLYHVFTSYDTLLTHIIARQDQDFPVAVSIPWGKGQFILSSTPLAFTNYYLLYGENNRYISGLLSYLPPDNLYRTEYYQLGRLEAQTPLRYILRTDPLRWAYYITILSVLLFMIFEAKRKQRIIPIIKPLQNTTLEFTGTIGNLYYENKDHKNIAEKRINFFMDRIREHYFIPPGTPESEYETILIKKSGHSTEKVKKLFDAINSIRQKEKINEEELITLNDSIEDFKIK